MWPNEVDHGLTMCRPTWRDCENFDEFGRAAISPSPGWDVTGLDGDAKRSESAYTYLGHDSNCPSRWIRTQSLEADGIPSSPSSSGAQARPRYFLTDRRLTRYESKKPFRPARSRHDPKQQVVRPSRRERPVHGNDRPRTVLGTRSAPTRKESEAQKSGRPRRL